MRRRLLSALLTMCAFSTIAAAGPLYVGGAYGNTKLKANDTNFNFDASNPGWKAFVGYRLLKFLGVEAGYTDFGSPTDKKVTIGAKGWDYYAIGALPVGPIDLFAKVGAISWKTDVSGLGKGHDTGTDTAYGAGVLFHVSHVGIRAQYEKFQVQNTDNLYMISVGAEWRFK
ncbi:MAG: outer membrane beta-barrel protein [Acidobacteria bacterium]|nr:outer membrane beta-barrel protein [Acidobacteriota bacterium]